MSESQQGEELWKKMKAGDRSAFEQLYKENILYLFNYGRRIIPDNDVVQDMIQDTFVYLWNKRATLSQTTNPRAYMAAALRHRLYKSHKSSHGTSVDIEHIQDPGVIDKPFELNAEDIDVRRKIEHAMDELSDQQKLALQLKYFQNMSYEDISQHMNIRYQSARNLVSAAIKRLRSTDLSKKIK